MGFLRWRRLLVPLLCATLWVGAVASDALFDWSQWKSDGYGTAPPSLGWVSSRENPPATLIDAPSEFPSTDMSVTIHHFSAEGTAFHLGLTGSKPTRVVLQLFTRFMWQDTTGWRYVGALDHVLLQGSIQYQIELPRILTPGIYKLVVVSNHATKKAPSQTFRINAQHLIRTRPRQKEIDREEESLDRPAASDRSAGPDESPTESMTKSTTKSTTDDTTDDTQHSLSSSTDDGGYVESPDKSAVHAPRADTISSLPSSPQVTEDGVKDFASMGLEHFCRVCQSSPERTYQCARHMPNHVVALPSAVQVSRENGRVLVGKYCQLYRVLQQFWELNLMLANLRLLAPLQDVFQFMQDALIHPIKSLDTKYPWCPPFATMNRCIFTHLREISISITSNSVGTFDGIFWRIPTLETLAHHVDLHYKYKIHVFPQKGLYLSHLHLAGSGPHEVAQYRFVLPEEISVSVK